VLDKATEDLQLADIDVAAKHQSLTNFQSEHENMTYNLESVKLSLERSSGKLQAYKGEIQ